MGHDIENASDDELFDDRYVCGSIVLSHQGCEYYDRLVITGPQAGYVWSNLGFRTYALLCWAAISTRCNSPFNQKLAQPP